MKVKVIRKFSDRYTGQRYARGDVLEITEERYKEILRVGELVLPFAQNNALSVGADDTNTLSNEPAETSIGDSTQPDDGFEQMTVPQLKEYADKTYKLTFGTGTKKAEIIEKLRRLERNGK